MYNSDSKALLTMLDDACREHNIPENLSQFEKERRLFAEIFRTHKIPESLDKKRKAEKYSFLEGFIRPSLFRYRKITDFNIKALRGDYIPVARPSRMKATGDEADSQIIINYEKIQSEFSMHLSFDINYFAKWAFDGKPFPEEALKLVSQEMQEALEKAQGFMKGNLQLKPMLRVAQNHIRAELSKLTPNSGIKVIDVLQKSGYIACFCEDVCRNDMWEEFAKNEKGEDGYALEYDFKSLNLNYSSPEKNRNFMVLPVIYGEDYDATDLMVFGLLSDWLRRIVRQKPLVLFDELGWIRGYFYKKEKFRPEDEWRLVTPVTGTDAKPKIIGVKKDDDFSEVYVSPKAIYYALNIDKHSFDELDKIAVLKGLTRYRMIEDRDSGTLKPKKL